MFTPHRIALAARGTGNAKAWPLRQARWQREPRPGGKRLTWIVPFYLSLS